MADDEEVGLSLKAKGVAAFEAAMARARRSIKSVKDETAKVDSTTKKLSKTEREAQRERERITARHVASYQRQMGAVSGFTSGLVASTARAGSVAAVGFTGAGIAASAYGIKLAGSMEQTEVAFGTLLGGAEEADAKIKELQAFAAQTPFTFVGLTEVSKRLLAMGFTAEQLIPTLTTVGDAAAALGGGEEAVVGITRALGQMRMKGTLSAEEVNQQLAEWGINGWDYLAKASGKSAAQVMKDAERGMISGKAASDAILQGLATDPRFSGMMDKQSQTFLGKVSNFKDKAQAGLTKAFRPITDELGSMLPSATRIAGKALDWFGKQSAKGIAKFKTYKPQIKAFGMELQGAWRAGGATGVAGLLDNKMGTTAFTSLHDMGIALKDMWNETLWPLIKEHYPKVLHLVDIIANTIRGVASWVNDGKQFWGGLLEVVGVLIGALQVLKDLMTGDFWGKALNWVGGNGYGGSAPAGAAVGSVAPIGTATYGIAGQNRGLLPQPNTNFVGPRVGMANGGTVTRAGYSWVGERGPEVLKLPRSAQVQPLDTPDAQAILGDRGGVTIQNLTISGASAYDSKKLVEQLKRGLRSELARK